MIDKEGRKINYLRISLTDKCNLRCIYCMPNNEKCGHNLSTDLSTEDIMRIISVLASLGIDKVRFTGGEPLIIKNIDEIIYRTSQIKAIRDISITTNGLLLTDRIQELKNSGLKRVNISLDTLKEDRYALITGGGDINKVIAGIEEAMALNLTPIKLNVVLMRGINDDEINNFIALTKEIPVDVRFIELMPIGAGIELFQKHFISAEEVIAKYPQLIKKNKEKSTTADLYNIEGSKGNIGFIKPLSSKFCSECNRLRLSSDGCIKPCLHSEKEYNIMPYVSNNIILKKKLEEIIYNKPIEHTLLEDKQSRSKKNMYEIGG